MILWSSVFTTGDGRLKQEVLIDLLFYSQSVQILRVFCLSVSIFVVFRFDLVM